MEKPAPWTPPTSLRPSFPIEGGVIRPWTHADARAHFEAINETRDRLRPWMPWAQHEHRTIEQTTYMIERFIRSAANPLAPEHIQMNYVLGVFDDHGEVIGGTGFNRMDIAAHNAETGYWVRASRHRQGWCTRMLRGMLTWGFTPQSEGGFGFRRIHIFAAAANVASCGVPTKLGLNRHSHARADRWVDGIGWADTVGWDVLAEEWDGAGRVRRT